MNSKNPDRDREIKELDSLLKEGLSEDQLCKFQEKLKTLDPGTEAPVRLRNKLILIPEEQESGYNWFRFTRVAGVAVVSLVLMVIFFRQEAGEPHRPAQVAVSRQTAGNELNYLIEDVVIEFDLFEPDVAALGNI